MFNELIVGAITPFSGTNDPDKNGGNPAYRGYSIQELMKET